MKKIFFTLLALVGTMSMNAQVMKVMKNGQDTPVETYSGSDYYVVFEEAPAFPFGQGEAEATGIGKVKWIQLWENGPKFAEYNVGAANNKAEDYGGYYNWGMSEVQTSSNYSNYKSGTDPLTGADDTATKLWGSNWRMPTSAELSYTKDGLLYECDCTWTTNYNGTGKNGLLCTGKGNYSSNSVFLPAAGYYDKGTANDQGSCGLYWSSTPNGSYGSFKLYFCSDGPIVINGNRFDGYSVRAVLAE